MKTPLKFPTRLCGEETEITLRLPEAMGGGAKIFLRSFAKERLAGLYHQPIEIEAGICGRSDSGDEIPINSLGRWLFGVPGFKGHVRVDGWQADCKIRFPKDSPKVVHSFFRWLKKAVEKERR